MLTVQMMIGSVQADRQKRQQPEKYQGNTTGAHRRDTAMGQANDRSGDLGRRPSYSQPGCSSKSDEHRQPSEQLRRRD